MSNTGMAVLWKRGHKSGVGGFQRCPAPTGVAGHEAACSAYLDCQLYGDGPPGSGGFVLMSAGPSELPGPLLPHAVTTSQLASLSSAWSYGASSFPSCRCSHRMASVPDSQPLLSEQGVHTRHLVWM